MRQARHRARQGYGIRPRLAPRLGGLAGRVDLDVDVDGFDDGSGGAVAVVGRSEGGDELAPVLGEELRLLLRVDARDAPEVGDLGEVLAVVWLFWG